MSVSPRERDVLRRLAGQIAQAAALPIQQQRTRLWKDFNALRPRRPMVLAFPEGGWRDLVKDDEAQCQDPLLRSWEMQLRRRAWHIQHIHDDQPITPFFNLQWVKQFSDYGLAEEYHRTDPLGSHVWDAPVKAEADFRKLHPRTFAVDRAQTARQVELATGIFGDLLTVQVRHHIGWPASLTWTLIRLRGLTEVMQDLYDNPGLLHKMMAFLRDDRLAELDFVEREDLLALNNGPDDYVGSGGLGGTDELPAADFAGRVRPIDLWGFGECQEFVQVSPEHWFEFVLKYQLPLLERFGLNHYGCCEPLDRKFDLLFNHVPRLRRLSISPWTDRALAAERLGGRYIYSWKPAPSMICVPTVDWQAVEKHVRETLAMTRSCAIEMVMKDTHTFCGDPARIERWTDIASAAAQA